MPTLYGLSCGKVPWGYSLYPQKLQAFTCGEGDHKSGHPALRPLHGPSAQKSYRHGYVKF